MSNHESEETLDFIVLALGNHEQDEDVKSAKEVDRDSGTGDDKVSSILGSDQEAAEDNVEEQGKLFWCQV